MPNLEAYRRRICISALSMLVLLGWRQAPAELSGDAVPVTVADLAQNPQKFDGRLVRVDALFVYGWEGDDFVSDPKPEATRPPHLWVYWKREHQPDIGAAFRADRESIEAWFTGYFDSVPNHRANGMFDPGPFQLEVIKVSNPQLSPSLSAAIHRKDWEGAHKMIHGGTNLNAWDEYDLFPLYDASAVGNTGFVQDLLNAGADPNFTGPGGDTALMAAAWSCKLGVAKALIAHGANVNAADVNGETALILSSQTCSDGQMTQLLLDAKADPNPRTKNDRTPLMAAAKNPLVAEKLLEAGADPAAKDAYGNTAEGESCDRGAEGFYQVCQLVRKALGKAGCEPGHCN